MEIWYEADDFGPHITAYRVVKETDHTLIVVTKGYSFSGDGKDFESRRDKTGFYRTFDEAKAALLSKYQRRFAEAQRDLNRAISLREEGSK